MSSSVPIALISSKYKESANQDCASKARKFQGKNNRRTTRIALRDYFTEMPVNLLTEKKVPFQLLFRNENLKEQIQNLLKKSNP